jgi:hypothetical protein
VIGLLLLTAVSISAGPSGDAPSEHALIAQAEHQYHVGLETRADAAQAGPHFREAAATYERLRELGVHNPLLARNLAQAHLLAGDLAESIRAYHLGLRMAPYDKDLQAGLAYAREQIQYPTIGNLGASCRPRERRSLLEFASADTFGAAAALGYLMAMLAFARAWMTRRAGSWISGSLLLAASIVMVSWTWWEEQCIADVNRLPLVIVAENGTPLHRGNGEDYPLRLNDKLPAGVEMRVLAERGGWLQVQLAGGEVGWVEKDRVVMV